VSTELAMAEMLPLLLAPKPGASLPVAFEVVPALAPVSSLAVQASAAWANVDTCNACIEALRAADISEHLRTPLLALAESWRAQAEGRLAHRNLMAEKREEKLAAVVVDEYRVCRVDNDRHLRLVMRDGVHRVNSVLAGRLEELVTGGRAAMSWLLDEYDRCGPVKYGADPERARACFELMRCLKGEGTRELALHAFVVLTTGDTTELGLSKASKVLALTEAEQQAKQKREEREARELRDYERASAREAKRNEEERA
jgi:hypothetical protein